MAVLSTDKLQIDIPGRADGSPLDISIQPGELWGVLGPNGAGKTTLLHTLAGLRAPRHGGVSLDGTDLRRLNRRQVARTLAVVFQDHQDSFPATVLETALVGRHPHLSPWDLDTAEDMNIALDALARLELSGMESRVISTLSGGERQRLAITTALTQQPAIWLADEPTNHLDLHHQVAIMRLLRDQAHSGQAVFMCLHDLNIAARWCDRLLLLQPDGQACWGRAEEMLVPDALERLYGQRLQVGTINGARVFVPVE
ncbi:iron complex transport system ATP-binding protein [Natronospira proteinivora]|uniref:Iron complex transport system ATP-binding protein n=1 Tax=Natronospira proteinivora TaxID=1807133 RepID=A0ABT1G939_9GAMM|nr:ABC transporter ATP-binding protein [Natronospira proteinivora]MCP1726843.1 iron complex transport system ATP-binding protein [Natronospira proteinivora]